MFPKQNAILNATLDTAIECMGICTEAQLEILTACVLGGDDVNRAFNQSITLELQGTLSVPTIDKALQMLVERNQAFRTLFNIQETKFIVLNELPLQLEIIKVENKAELLKSTKDQCKKDVQHIFDICNGPLFKATLIQAKQDHRLVITAHHVVCDGWTLGLLIKELGVLYSDLIKNTESTLSQALEFENYALNEQEFHSSKEYSKVIDYWTNALNDYKPNSALPYDHPRQANLSYKSNHQSVDFNPDVFRKVKATAKENNCSVLISMVAIFEILRFRKSGVRRFVTGIPTAGQPAANFDSLMGHCVNMLPVLCEIDGDLSFAEFLAKRKQAYTEAFENKRITFGSILKSLVIDRNPIADPLVPVTFNIDRPLMEGVSFEGLQCNLQINVRDYSSFDMIMNISRIEDNLQIECSYNSALFEDITVSNFITQYEFLAEQLCEDSSKSINSFSLYNREELVEKYKTWNSTSCDTCSYHSFQKAFEGVVKEYTNSKALVFNNKVFDYTSLNEKINKLSHYLIEKGVQKGAFVGVMVERGPEMLVALIAVMKSGAAYIPIDPHFPKDRIEYMLQDSAAKMLICSSGYSIKTSEGTQCISIDTAISESQNYSSENPAINYNESDIAYLMYTSGSTGLPKGVIIKHSSLINLLKSMQKSPGIKAGDSLLSVTTVSFDIAGLELYLPLISAATLVLADNDTCKDGALLLKSIHDNKVNIMQATPSTFKLMLASSWSDKTSIKFLCGGEPLSKELAQKLLPKCSSLWNMYGPTETTIWSTCKEIFSNDETISIGKPIDNTDIFIVDIHNNLLPAGTIGEICIGGSGLAKEYLNRDSLNAEKFTKHPYKDGERIYHTGDLGKLSEDGNLICLGRNDQQIKVRGYRIESGEIEYHLSQLKGITEAIVLPVKWSDDDVRITAFIQSKDSNKQVFKKVQSIEVNALDKQKETDIKHELAKVLPEYMIPTYCIGIHEFPLTANGKTDKKKLESICTSDFVMDLQNDNNKPTETSISDKPDSYTVRVLKELWEETLGVKNAGVEDDFFESGGHSLVGIELMFKIETKLGIKLPLASLFSQPNIKGLALLIDKKERPSWKYLVEIKPEGNKTPLYLVHGAGLEVLVFQDLIKYVDTEQPVIAIQAVGLNDDEYPGDSIEEIAAKYVREIIQHNPHGPYSIAGFSAGSIIAFEIARQINAQGRTISFLGNFDFAVDNLIKKIPVKQKLMKMISEFIPRQIHAFKCLFLFPKQAFKFQKEFARLRIMSNLARLGFNVEEVETQQMEKKYRIMEHYQKALASYKIKSYDGAIDLFLSRIKVYYIKDKETLGWKPYALKGIRRHKVNGDHDSMILPPNSKSFAKKLQEVLDKNTTQYT